MRIGFEVFRIADEISRINELSHGIKRLHDKSQQWRDKTDKAVVQKSPDTDDIGLFRYRQNYKTTGTGSRRKCLEYIVVFCSVSDAWHGSAVDENLNIESRDEILRIR